MTQKKVTQLEVAEVQLNRAIQLFLDEHDYYSSGTLAGAAEEILGRLLKKEDKETSLDNSVSVIEKMLSAEEIRAIAPDSKSTRPSKSILSSELNQYRNWLKHYMEDDFIYYANPKEAAEDLIDRAAANFWQLLTKETTQTRRFYEYQRDKSE